MHAASLTRSANFPESAEVPDELAMPTRFCPGRRVDLPKGLLAPSCGGLALSITGARIAGQGERRRIGEFRNSLRCAAAA